MTNLKQGNHAQDFFLYLLVFLSLGFLAIGSGSILFQAISKLFPDKISNIFDQGSVRFGIAALLIAGPIFILVSKIINKKISNALISMDSSVRKWLTYIVLFIAAAVVIGDLIALVFNYLNGETTIQFFLKVLVILLISGSIFAYYFWDVIKSKNDKKRNRINRIVSIVTIIFIVSIFIGALFVVDRPSLAREKRIDSQTSGDIQSIDGSIRNYFNQAGKLPQSLKDLEKTGFAPYLQSENNIEYVVTGENTFNLCSNFLRSNLNDNDATPYYKVNEEEWKHGSGKFCFERKVLKDKTPIAPVK